MIARGFLLIINVLLASEPSAPSRLIGELFSRSLRFTGLEGLVAGRLTCLDIIIMGVMLYDARITNHPEVSGQASY